MRLFARVLLPTPLSVAYPIILVGWFSGGLPSELTPWLGWLTLALWSVAVLVSLPPLFHPFIPPESPTPHEAGVSLPSRCEACPRRLARVSAPPS